MTKLTGERLRNLRMMHGLRREDMAPLLGYSCDHLGALERGEYPVPADLSPRLAKVLQDRRDLLERECQAIPQADLGYLVKTQHSSRGDHLI